MKEYGAMEQQLHSFLTLALGAVSCQLHALANLLSRKKSPSTHSIGDMIGLTAGPGAFMKINNYWTCQELS
jgi:hypothetical protein